MLPCHVDHVSKTGWASKIMRVIIFSLFLLVLGLTFVSQARAQASLNLMPLPAKLQVGVGQLVIDPSFSVTTTGDSDARLQRAVDRFLNDLRRQTGMLPLDMQFTTGPTAKLVIHTDRASKEVQELGEDESYTLEITSTGANLSAPNPLGILHGLQTFLQLVENTSAGFAVPAVSIQDQPRFPWRGLMIDVGRHFIPLDVLKRNLDGMAAVKLNVLHWHLSENQGFRIESKKFPKLQEFGSDGEYYAQEEVRDLIAYAQDRGIRVVPEFDMPGHSTAWFVGYPELASGKGPYAIERRWGVFDPAMDPTQERTYKFLDEFIGEMAKLFPDHYFHIGGDEVNGKEWDANPKIQQFMHARKIKSNDELQAYFNQHVQVIVSKHGKTMMGWDEILKPELPKDVVIQSWRGAASLAEAARDGYGVLLSSGYYLDLIQPTSQHYAVDPMAGAVSTLTPEQQQHILGGEACMWAEYVSAENIDSRIWPRAAAIAERLWSPQSVTDLNSMYQRMGVTSRWLDGLGLTHNSSYELMLRRIAGSDDIAALRTLADVVEPTKEYTRSALAVTEPTALTPLNRLVDAARPESMTARHFASLVDALISRQAKPKTAAEIRALLTRWQDNYSALQSRAGQSFLIPEVLPISQDLSALGAAALQALDYLGRGEPAPDNWKAAQLDRIAQAEKPKAQLLLMIAPSIQKLIAASARPAAKSTNEPALPLIQP
jgi:hexosaminidase